jgi:D-tyrosyl-tRNA(Tyr) deacylase
MIALLQRVARASVTVESEIIASINNGLLVFIGVEKNDTAAQTRRLAERVLACRLFADAEAKMNLSLRDIQGEILLVSQFTLAADTRSGNRPGFSSAATPAEAEHLFAQLVAIMQQQASVGAINKVQCGRFGANMAVELVNDGPVTFWLQT